MLPLGIEAFRGRTYQEIPQWSANLVKQVGLSLIPYTMRVMHLMPHSLIVCHIKSNYKNNALFYINIIETTIFRATRKKNLENEKRISP